MPRPCPSNFELRNSSFDPRNSNFALRHETRNLKLETLNLRPFVIRTSNVEPRPFVKMDEDNPVSLYAATKKSNELMAHAYSKLYNIPSTGLRFFTVYGPAGRPDMAYFGFTNKLVKGEKIQIFNYGNCKRDFTYVDDIVEGVIRVMMKAPAKQVGEDGLPIPPYKVYNIGNNSPENLLDFVTILLEELIRAGVLPQDYNFEAHKELVPMQPGDVPVTYADTSALEADFGFKPSTSLREGLRKFAEWYVSDNNPMSK